jgi:hypothetical protein
MVVALIVAVPSSAAPKRLPAGEAEPPASGQAWYWENQQVHEVQDPVGNTHTVTGPNPFCPSAPGDLGAVPGACAPGRLPVEVVGGDYTTPDKVSAVTFDFSLVPLGSKISKFEVTFLEAKGGCYENEGGTPPQRCEQTAPVNVAEQELQACQVNDFFGSGSARPYNEVPKFQCSKSDPVGTRKEGQVKGIDEPSGDQESADYTWTFDLTSLAQKWATGAKQTSILIVPKPPANYDADQQAPNDSWRVVLSGPEAKQGVITSLKYTPPATPPPPPPPGGGTGSVDAPVDTGFGSGTTDFGADTGTDPATDFGDDTGTDPVTDAADDTADTGDATTVAAEGPSNRPESFPMYMWLAIIAGLVGFTMVRSIVIEKATGVRPNGVLAQIKSLNSARNGGAAAATTTASSGGIGSALGAVGQGFSSFAGKLKSIFKRG